MVADFQIPLAFLIKTVGLDKLKANSDLAKQFVKRATVTPIKGVSWKSDLRLNVIVDVRSLVLLTRITGPCDEINRLFSLDQSSRLLEGGLDIDETWIKDGSLGWFTSLKHRKDLPPTTRFSLRDVRAAMCSAMYSALDPKLLAPNSQWIKDDVTKAIHQMYRLAMSLFGFYFNSSGHRKVFPPLTVLLKLSKKLPKTDDDDNPIAFDVKEGLAACLEKSPSVIALIAGLVKQLGEKFTMQSPVLDAEKINLIVFASVAITGIDAEDMLWVLRYCDQMQADNLLKIAISSMCNKVPCMTSSYYLKAEHNGMLGWKYISLLINVLLLPNNLHGAIATLLGVFDYFAFVPHHVARQNFDDASAMIKDAKDGVELSNDNRKLLVSILQKPEV